MFFLTVFDFGFHKIFNFVPKIASETYKSKPVLLLRSEEDLDQDFAPFSGDCRPVVPGDAGGPMAPPDFGRSVNPISTKGGRLCPPNDTCIPEFSDLPTALVGRQSDKPSETKLPLKEERIYLLTSLKNPNPKNTI